MTENIEYWNEARLAVVRAFADNNVDKYWTLKGRVDTMLAILDGIIQEARDDSRGI
jgi:hypothetical protein